MGSERPPPLKRREERVPALLVVHYRIEGREAFIERYSANVSQNGIFIATRETHPVGSVVSFEIRAADGSTAFRAKGVVRWIRSHDPSKKQVPGLGVQFTEIDDDNRITLNRMIEQQKAAAPAARAETPAVTPAEAALLEASRAQGAAPRPAAASRRRWVWSAGLLGLMGLATAVVVLSHLRPSSTAPLAPVLPVARLPLAPPEAPSPPAVAQPDRAESEDGATGVAVVQGSEPIETPPEVPAPRVVPAGGKAKRKKEPVPPAPPPAPPLSLDEQIRQIVQSRSREVQLCYDRLLKEKPDLKGRVTLELVTNSRGKVEDLKVVDNTTADWRVARCLREVLKGLAFPAVDEETVIQVPFYLTPDRLTSGAAR